jgi:ribosomal protein S18 acetylase RimI-like enzyme
MRNLIKTDLLLLRQILVTTNVFTDNEVDCAMDLLDTVLNDPHQKDYQVGVADFNGEVAGYVMYGPVPLTDNCYEIYWLATDPETRGNKVGQQLLREVELRVRRAGARLVCLETSSLDKYARSRKFYQQAGYQEESRIVDFYRLGDDRITYVKRFSPVQLKD